MKSVSAFLPPLYTQDFTLNTNVVHAGFSDFDEGMQYAKHNNKPVMVDFSGYGCVNCRKMEAKVFTDPKVKTALEKEYVLITLFVDDNTDLDKPYEVQENGRKTKLKTVGDKWSYLQRHKFGTNSQPYYVTLDNEGYPIGPSYAYDENIEKYIKFLETGLDNYKEKMEVNK